LIESITPLRLDYTGLKKRLDGVADPKKKATKPAFVELIADHSATMADCVIDFESSVGSKMRIQWKGSTAPDGDSVTFGHAVGDRRASCADDQAGA
jgi:hypothetical protein